MKLIYTGANTAGQPQADPANSLGGYRSNSVIPNERKGNLFGEVSYLGMANEYQEARGIVMYNDGADIPNLKIGVLPQTATINYKLMMAVVTLTADQMERLPNMNAIPYSATFYEKYMVNPADTVNMLNLGAMAAGAYLGVWFIRQMKNGVGDTQQVFNDITGTINYFGKITYTSPADDTETFSDERLKNASIDVYRGGILQTVGTQYTFDSSGGEITFIPALANEEVIEIRQITNSTPATPDFDNTTEVDQCEYYANALSLNKNDGFDFILITT